MAPVLTSKNLLSPNSDIKLRHAVIGLLKNVSQSATPTSIIPVELGNAGIIEAIVGSGVWDQQHDAMVEVVQVGAIGVVKHLCNTSGERNKYLWDDSLQILNPVLLQFRMRMHWFFRVPALVPLVWTSCWP